MPLLSFYAFRAKRAINNFFTDEKGEVNVIAIVLLIAVAVALVIIFKDSITSLITDLLGKTTEKANSVID